MVIFGNVLTTKVSKVIYILISLIVSLYNVHIRLKHHIAPLRQFLNSLIGWLIDCVSVCECRIRCVLVSTYGIQKRMLIPQSWRHTCLWDAQLAMWVLGSKLWSLWLFTKYSYTGLSFQPSPRTIAICQLRINDWKQVEWIKFLPAYVLEISLPNL